MIIPNEHLDCDSWYKTLKDFYDKTIVNKHYDKLEYDVWRRLLKTQFSGAIISYSKEDKKIRVSFENESLSPFTFESDDNSFGIYLFEKYFEKDFDEAFEKYFDGITLTPDNSNLASTTTATINSNLIKSISIADEPILKAYVDDGTFYYKDIDNIKEEIETIKKTLNKNEKEDKKMKNFNFDFGPCNDKVRMSMYGLAIQNASGTWVSYNPATAEIIDVDIFNFNGAKFMYKIPVAIKDVVKGDIVIHNKKPMFVSEVKENESAITCIDVFEGEKKQIIPTTNMFGFNFITKVVSLFNTINMNAPTPDAPFGNMLPLMLLDESGENEKIDPMMLMFLMGNGKIDISNPMMMYFMFKNKGDNDMLPFLFMMNNNNNK